MSKNYFSLTIDVRMLSKALRKAGLLPHGFSKKEEDCHKFKKAFVELGGNPAEAEIQLKSEREWLNVQQTNTNSLSKQHRRCP